MNRRTFLYSLAAFGIAQKIPVSAIAAVAARDWPIGTLIPFWSQGECAILTEHGWMPCVGQMLLKPHFPITYSVLRGIYGENELMFCLPNCKGGALA